MFPKQWLRRSILRSHLYVYCLEQNYSCLNIRHTVHSIKTGNWIRVGSISYWDSLALHIHSCLHFKLGPLAIGQIDASLFLSSLSMWEGERCTNCRSSSSPFLFSWWTTHIHILEYNQCITFYLSTSFFIFSYINVSFLVSYVMILLK